jgi:hypothetical protein
MTYESEYDFDRQLYGRYERAYCYSVCLLEVSAGDPGKGLARLILTRAKTSKLGYQIDTSVPWTINNYVSISRIAAQFFRYALVEANGPVYEVMRTLIAGIEDGRAVSSAG